MIGDVALYAASRATSSAIDLVARRAKWMVAGAILLVCAIVTGLIVTFWLAAAEVGAVQAAALIASGCLALGLLCMAMPFIIEKIEAMRRKSVPDVASTIAVVNEEAHEAVDYFGALQVVTAAFLFGLGAARHLKR